MAKYLNNSIKYTIMQRIKEDIISKIYKSKIGKEQSAAEKQIKKNIMAYFRKIYPKKEQIIIDKYNLGYEINAIVFFMNGVKVDLYVADFIGNNNNDDVIKICFKNRITVPKSLIARDWLLRNDTLINNVATALKTKYTINCEIANTIDAFKVEIDSYRTIEQMLKNHPTWRKYLKKPKKIKDANKIIEQFEKE